MALRSVVHRTIHDLPWEPLLGDRGASSLGPVWKTLTEDPETGATTYVVHLPPGWRTDILDWHGYVEEVFGLAGGIQCGDSWHGAGYVYRPPETLHGPYRIPGAHGYTVLHRQDRKLMIEHHREPQPGQKHGDTLSDAWKEIPMEWIDWLDPDSVPRQRVESGPWAGVEARWLNRDPRTGGGAVLLDLPAGWEGEGTRVGGVAEELVTEGALLAGGDELDFWGYACRADGRAAGRYSSAGGARVFCWWDVDELVE